MGSVFTDPILLFLTIDTNIFSMYNNIVYNFIKLLILAIIYFICGRGKTMWFRSDLKSNAKDVLRKYYWWGLLVCLVGGILSGQGGVGFTFKSNSNKNDFSDFDKIRDYFNNFFNIDWTFIASVAAIVIIIAFVVMILAIAYQIFIGNVIIVGRNKFFIEARKDKAKFTDLFYSFDGKRHLNIVKSMAWMNLFVFLWSLLFIIPGIVKQFAYSMVPYIMAENPNMQFNDALKLSMKMTDGEKWDIFVLGLSFIGWFILGTCCCVIGIILLLRNFCRTLHSA